MQSSGPVDASFPCPPGGSSNGRTAAFGVADGGSNPPPPAIYCFIDITNFVQPKPNRWEVITNTTMADRNESSNIIDRVEATSDTLTSRSGLSIFVRYLRNIAILPVLERLFGSMRKSSKGQPVSEVFKQVFGFLLDGTSRHLKMVRHLVKFIRKHYGEEVPIIIRLDAGFFDQKLFTAFAELQIGYICSAYYITASQSQLVLQLGISDLI